MYKHTYAHTYELQKDVRQQGIKEHWRNSWMHIVSSKCRTSTIVTLYSL